MEDKARYDKVVAYVWSKYPNYKNKTLIVKEFDNHFKMLADLWPPPRT